jgi:2-dehydropantoate 2-reductase
MKLVVLGAGALGCVYGGMLAQAGHDVTLVARGEHYAAMKNDGLTILTSSGSLRPALKVVDAPRAVKESDVAFVTVKARDTSGILEASKHLFERTVFVSFQNSGEKDEILSRYVGARNVIGGVAMVAGTRVRPGVVEATYVGRTWLGELPRGTSERVERLTAVLDSAGLSAIAADDITAVKWVKLIQYCAYAGVSALTRLRFYEIAQDPRLLEVYIELLREGGRVMKAAGTEPEDQKGLPPIKKFMELPKDALIQEYSEKSKGFRSRHETISMLQDVLRSRPTEADDTLGYVIRKAAENGVDTPVMSSVHALIRGLETSYSRA